MQDIKHLKDKASKQIRSSAFSNIIIRYSSMRAGIGYCNKRMDASLYVYRNYFFLVRLTNVFTTLP